MPHDQISNHQHMTVQARLKLISVAYMSSCGAGHCVCESRRKLPNHFIQAFKKYMLRWGGHRLDMGLGNEISK